MKAPGELAANFAKQALEECVTCKRKETINSQLIMGTSLVKQLDGYGMAIPLKGDYQIRSLPKLHTAYLQKESGKLQIIKIRTDYLKKKRKESANCQRNVFCGIKCEQTEKKPATSVLAAQQDGWFF